jgi:hypothetical protein
MKKFIALSLIFLASCTSPADIASHNLSKAADNFQVNRRIVFFNGITDTYLLSIEGRCSLGNADQARELSVTCKTGPEDFKKHFLGLSDNVSYFVEQLQGIPVSTYHYKVFFRPKSIIPDVDVQNAGK